MLPSRFLAAVLALAALSPAAAHAGDTAQPGMTLLVGRPSGLGTLPDDSVNDSSGTTESVSSNGRYVTFSSDADALSAEDNDAFQNVYVRDLQTNTTTLVSRATGVAGAAADGNAFGSAISGDGTKVAFTSSAQNLGATGTQVYVRDLVAHTTTIVSCANTTNCTPGGGSEPSINSDGTKIAFTSASTALATDTNTVTDIFVRNTATNSTVLVSRKTGAGGTQVSQPSSDPSISDDGNRVVWESGGQLDVTDTGSGYDVYLRDITGNLTRWVSHSASTTLSSTEPSIAGNGSLVAFQTQVAFDAGHDVNGLGDVYAWSYNLDAFTLISRIDGGLTNAGNGASYDPAAGTTGSQIAFLSTAGNLGDGDTNTTADVHLRSGGTTSLVSRADGPAGVSSNAAASRPAIDDAGAVIAWTSAADNLVPSAGGPGDGREFVRNTGTSTTVVASLPTGPGTAAFTATAGDDGLAFSYAFAGATGGNAISGDGRYVAFTSDANGLMSGDDDRYINVYVRDLLTNQLTLVSRATDGTAANAHSSQASISADGTHVAFESAATNLGAPGGVANGVYVRDLAAQTTVLASRADGASGTPATYGQGTWLSDDGHRVAFITGTSLDAHDTNAAGDAYVRDIVSDTTELASRADGSATNTGDGTTSAAAISGDGKRVGFLSSSTDLGDGDTDAFTNVHLRDLAANTTTLVDRADGATGAKAVGHAYGVSLDRTGNRVAFESTASGLEPGLVSSMLEVYVRDVGAGTTVLASRAGASGPPADGEATFSRISGDGRHVVFVGIGTDLQPPDTTNVTTVFVRDLDAQTTVAAARVDGPDGAVFNATTPAVNADASCVAFASNAALTASGYPSRDYSHVFVRVMARECPLVAPNTTIDSGPGATATFAFSGDETGVTFACSFDGGPYAACTSPTTSPVLPAGPHSFAVRATDRAALTDPSPATASFTVAGGAQKDTTAPSVSALKLSPARFRVKGRKPHGTRISYALSEPSSAVLTVARLRPGRRAGKHCAAPSKANRRAKRCTRFIAAGALHQATAAGSQSRRFSGRIGKHALSPGRYRLSVRATDAAGNRSKPRSATFRVLRP
ncbi:MAG: TolB family protein [Solirubrobacteraceae bacterium]